jgi:uncharacterized protein YbaR (Trm112 family)
MKRDFVNILACPVCKSSLRLEVSDEKNGEIVSGFLFCQKCNHKYTIKGSIPNLLPPDVC